MDKAETKITQAIDRAMRIAEERMKWAIGFTTIRYHFVYQVLAITRPVADPTMSTLGVHVEAGKVILSYSPEYIIKQTDPQLVYDLYHEVLHIALHHCTYRRFDNHSMGNQACDLAIGSLIPVVAGSCEPSPAPEGGFWCTVEEYKKHGYEDIKENQTAEWYYDYLRKRQKKDPSEKGNGQPGSGSGSGNPAGSGDGSDDKSGSGNGKGKPSGSGSNKDDKPTTGGQVRDDHSGWGQDEIADEYIRIKIKEISRGTSWGTLSSSAQELISAAQTRRINWRNILRRFYGNMVWPEREATRKRPNRRYGIQFPGSKKVTVDRHLVAIDTSGSIDSELLAMFLSILNQMLDYVPIDMMQFDWDKTQDPRPYDRKTPQLKFHGRGGTSFESVMKIADERHYKSVVILTDGVASAPTKPHAKVVWCMPEGCNAPVDWGLKIVITKY